MHMTVNLKSTTDKMQAWLLTDITDSAYLKPTFCLSTDLNANAAMVKRFRPNTT